MESSTKIEQFLRRMVERHTEISDFDCCIGDTGDFKKIKDIDVIIRSILNVLLTVRGTYLYDPEYGCSLYKYIFEPSDEYTQQDIISELNTAISKYEDRAQITYDVSFFNDKKGFLIQLVVVYNSQSRSINIPITESLLTTVE